MPCPGKVGAFSNSVDARAAIQAAMNAYFGVFPPVGVAPSANWQAARQQLIRGGTINVDVHVGGVVGHILSIKPDSSPYNLVGGGKMSNRGLPKYLGGTRCGGRPLYDTDTGFAGAMTPYVYTHPPGSANQWVGDCPGIGYIRYQPAIGLSIDNATPVGVHLRIIGHDVDGGWSIHSAWPI